MIWYVIEHPTRGMFKELDWDYGEPKPRFSSAANRNDEVVQRFNHLSRAQEMIAKMPLRIGGACYILELSKAYGERYPEIRRVTQAIAAEPTLATYFGERVPGEPEYEEDEATEYGDTPREKAANVGVDTGTFEQEIGEQFPGASVGYGRRRGVLVSVTFPDGSVYDYKGL